VQCSGWGLSVGLARTVSWVVGEASSVGLVGVVWCIRWGPMLPDGCGTYDGRGRRVMLGV
jgi:hypothetical protein